MVQKSQGQPPGMVLKPCKSWDKLLHQLVSWISAINSRANKSIYTQLAIYLPHTRRQGWSHSSFIGRRNMSQNPIICQVVMFVCNISWTMQWRTLALGRRVRVSAHPGWKPAGMGIWRRTSNLDPGEQLLLTDSTAISFCWSNGMNWEYESSSDLLISWSHHENWSTRGTSLIPPLSTQVNYVTSYLWHTCKHSFHSSKRNHSTMCRVSTGDRCVFVLRSLPIWCILCVFKTLVNDGCKYAITIVFLTHSWKYFPLTHDWRRIGIT